MNVGKRIKELRNEKGISTYKLSKLTGISQPVISKLEMGKRKYDLETIWKIAIALNISINDLIDVEKNKKETQISNIPTKDLINELHRRLGGVSNG